MLFRRALLALLLAVSLAVPVQAATEPVSGPSLVILAPQGANRDGLPVLQPHPDAQQLSEALGRGFPKQMTRLYHYVQVYRHQQGGPVPEPAYLVLKPQSGGFPQTGFYLGELEKRDTDYAEVGSRTITGGFGAADQIYPHELAHVIYQQLAGARPPAYTSQIHAAGVRTDPITAFDEGFAIHLQAMAIDHPDAASETHALIQNTGYQAVQQRLDQYREQMASPWRALTAARLGFRGWYAQDEQVLRYVAVKENAFARSPALPAGLLQKRNLYGAYLLENALPGAPQDPPKSASRMLSTEGVISTLFYRWATDPALQNTYRDAAFYTQFGTSRADLLPADNVYLKLFHTFAVKKPRTTVELIRGYKQLFPDEAEAVDRVVSVVLLGQPLPEHPEIWLANRDFQVGVTLFDQFRRDSHLHTFDLNAASLVDLLGVPGVDRPLVEAILQGAPYITLDDLQRVPGMTPAVMKQFRSMAEGMDRPDHVMNTILVSLGWYALSFMLLAGSLGGLAYWLVLRVRWWRALLNGLAIAVFSLLPGWVISGWMDLVLPLAPVLLFGVPAALWRLRRKRGSLGTGRQTLLAWGLAVIPALLLVHLRL